MVVRRLGVVAKSHSIQIANLCLTKGELGLPFRFIARHKIETSRIFAAIVALCVVSTLFVFTRSLTRVVTVVIIVLSVGTTSTITVDTVVIFVSSTMEADGTFCSSLLISLCCTDRWTSIVSVTLTIVTVTIVTLTFVTLTIVRVTFIVEVVSGLFATTICFSNLY